MNVSAIIITRGNVDTNPVIQSLPADWEIVLYDNGAGHVTRFDPEHSEGNRHARVLTRQADLAVYARYAAIEHASHDLIYVQDDDVIVSDPQAVVDMWDEMETLARIEQSPDPQAFLCANMPQEFRHHGYTDSCLVGFGACFHRDLPARAFTEFVTADIWKYEDDRDVLLDRTCDVVFTTLTPRVLVDVPIQHREFASDPDRMWKQPGHVGERARMLDLARQVRDA